MRAIQVDSNLAHKLEETCMLNQLHLQLGKRSPNFFEDTFGYTSWCALALKEPSCSKRMVTYSG